MKRDWQNMSDKELDDFFRHRAGNPDIPFQPADWKKMQAKLDQSVHVGGNGRSGAWYRNILINGLVAVLLLGTGVWIGAQYLTDQMDADEKSLSGAMVHNEEQANSQEIISPYGEEKGTGSAGQKLQDGQDTDVRSDHAVDEFPNAEKDQQEAYTNRTFAKKPTAFPVGAEDSNNTIAQDKSDFESSVELLDMHLWNTVANRKAVHLPMGLYHWDKRMDEIGLAKESVPTNPGGEQASTVQQQDFWNESRFSLSALLAPDVSALKINDIHGLGTSAGISWAYFIHPRWSVQAGALYAFKTYQGSEGYQVGYGSDPLGVKGNCWVVDVPLNLRYYPVIRPLDRWFVSSGLSSYFMLREDYTLQYVNNSGDPYSYEVQVSNKNRHYLGVMNFSVGYERMLTNRLSIQVEPYLKLPVAGIGEGGVSLKSAGTLVGIQYNW